MRFFNYLLSIVFLSFSSSAFSAVMYRMQNAQVNDLYSTKEAACSNWKHTWFGDPSVATKVGGDYCRAYRVSDNGSMGHALIIKVTVPDECWHPDYKIVVQSIKSPIKKTICIPNNGVLCKYTGDPSNTPVINGSVTSIFNSVSKVLVDGFNSGC